MDHLIASVESQMSIQCWLTVSVTFIGSSKAKSFSKSFRSCGLCLINFLSCLWLSSLYWYSWYKNSADPLTSLFASRVLVILSAVSLEGIFSCLGLLGKAISNVHFVAKWSEGDETRCLLTYSLIECHVFDSWNYWYFIHIINGI